MILHIDGDLVVFRCASTAESESEEIACHRVDEFIKKLLYETNGTECVVYLSGSSNFRYNVYPEYKANRNGKYRPKHEKACKAWVTANYNTEIHDMLEADDLLAIRQTDNTILCSIDKDLDQVPGWHYKWEQTRKGEVISEAKLYKVDHDSGLRNFYAQLITGDPTDNIKGVVGAGKKAARVLDSCETEEEMFNAVREMYGNDEEMLMNGQVLWMVRELDSDGLPILWRFPNVMDGGEETSVSNFPTT